MHGLHQVFDLFGGGLEQSFEEVAVEGGHVVPTDDVVGPLVVDLTASQCLPQLLVDIDIAL
jgi:hypothetical protein